MKLRSYLVIVFAAIFAIGCNTSKNAELENEIMKLRAANDSLAIVGEDEAAVVLSYVDSFNEVQLTLDSIKRLEKIISVNSKGENGKTSQNQINEDIKSIYKLLQKNKQLVSNLRSKLDKSDKKIVELETMIENLNAMLIEKDNEIQSLRGELAKLNIRVEEMKTVVADLSDENAQKAQKIAEQTQELNTAYYVIGSKSKLKESGIIKSNVLVKDLPKSAFTKIDITETSSIPVGGKKVDFKSNHPTSSYRIVGENGMIKSIEITNPKEFWSISKYLVLQSK